MAVPTYHHTSPPNQAASTTSGFKTFNNLSSQGSNVVNPTGSSTFDGKRIIDAFLQPEWWFAFQILFPNEWPWTLGGYNTWSIYFNTHATTQPATLGAGANGGAGWAFAQTSSIWIYTDPGAYAPPAGKVSLAWQIQQEDGQAHLGERFTDVTLGVWHSFLVHVVFGLSDASRWNLVQNPSSGRRIGLIEAWVDNDIVNAPNTPTYSHNPVGTLRAGVDPTNNLRYCQRWLAMYEGQLYAPSYTESSFNNSGTAHMDYRCLQMGQTLQACLAETVTPIGTIDFSSYAGFSAKGGTGTNFGDHTAVAISDPGGFPVPGGTPVGGTQLLPALPQPADKRYGNDTAFGITSGTLTADRSRLTRVSVTQVLDVTTLYVYLTGAPTATQDVTLVLYDNAGVELAAGPSITLTSPAAGWLGQDLTTPLRIPIGTYWVGVLSGTTGGTFAIASETTADNQFASFADTYVGGPAPSWGSPTFSAQRFSAVIDGNSVGAASNATHDPTSLRSTSVARSTSITRVLGSGGSPV